MHNTMYMSGGPGLFLFGGLHVLAALAFVTGLLFLLFWAFKHLTSAQLWKWGWILAGSGAVLLVLTMAGMAHGGRRMMMQGTMPPMMMDRGGDAREWTDDMGVSDPEVDNVTESGAVR